MHSDGPYIYGRDDLDSDDLYTYGMALVTYIAMAYIAMAYMAMAYTAMAYIVVTAYRPIYKWLSSSPEQSRPFLVSPGLASTFFADMCARMHIDMRMNRYVWFAEGLFLATFRGMPTANAEG